MDNTISNEEEIIPAEETLETDIEVEATETPTVDDYNRILKENQTLKAQKEHFKKKAEKVGQATTTKTETSPDNFMSREEAVLIAQGYDLEDLDNLKAIQRGAGLKSFKEALENPLFKSYHKDKKAEQRRKDASLGASGNSGNSKSEVKPNMSEDEHKELWAKHYQK